MILLYLLTLNVSDRLEPGHVVERCQCPNGYDILLTTTACV